MLKIVLNNILKFKFSIHFFDTFNNFFHYINFVFVHKKQELLIINKDTQGLFAKK